MNIKKKVAIITAMEKEYSKACELAKNPPKGYEIVVELSGIGKVNAAIATQKAIYEYSPDLIISFGLAGGLLPNILGDIVSPKRVFYWDVWCGTPNEYGQVQGLPLFYNCATDPIIEEWISKSFNKQISLCESVGTSDKFADETVNAKKVEDIDKYAAAIDMECAAVAQVCYKHYVDFMAVKLISDIVGSPNQIEQYKEALEKL